MAVISDLEEDHKQNQENPSSSSSDVETLASIMAKMGLMNFLKTVVDLISTRSDLFKDESSAEKALAVVASVKERKDAERRKSKIEELETRKKKAEEQKKDEEETKKKKEEEEIKKKKKKEEGDKTEVDKKVDEEEANGESKGRKNIQETCGPRGYVPTEVPRLFIVRYKRNSTENEILAKKKAKNIWNAYQEEDINIASQLVARYNGLEDVQEIIQWITKIIEDGDTSELPYFVDNTPELIPDDADPIWTKSAHGVLIAGSGLKHRIQSIICAIRDRIKDSRVGPFFLLMACISFATIWLQNCQPTQPAQPGAHMDEGADRRSRLKTERSKLKSPLNNVAPTSITDEVPKDAYQMLSSGSDSE